MAEGQGRLIVQAAEISSSSEIYAGTLRKVDASSTLLRQTTFLDLGPSTPNGLIVQAVMEPWRKIASEIEHNPNFRFEFVKQPRRFEEFIAGAYEQAGWQVELTPHSGDLGRDVIAVRQTPTPIRLLDQCKAFSPGHIVTADDVRAMYGVLSEDLNAAKAVVTTTSKFAAGITSEFRGMMPYRLELRDGKALADWLRAIVRRENK